MERFTSKPTFSGAPKPDAPLANTGAAPSPMLPDEFGDVIKAPPPNTLREPMHDAPGGLPTMLDMPSGYWIHDAEADWF